MSSRQSARKASKCAKRPASRNLGPQAAGCGWRRSSLTQLVAERRRLDQTRREVDGESAGSSLSLSSARPSSTAARSELQGQLQAFGNGQEAASRLPFAAFVEHQPQRAFTVHQPPGARRQGRRRGLASAARGTTDPSQDHSSALFGASSPSCRSTMRRPFTPFGLDGGGAASTCASTVPKVDATREAAAGKPGCLGVGRAARCLLCQCGEQLPRR